MMDLLRLLSAPCRDIAALISQGMDAELSRSQRWAMRLHVLYCSACRAYRRQLHWLRRLLLLAARRAESANETSLVAPLPGLALSEEARRRIGRALENV